MGPHRKIGLGVCGPLPKTLTLVMTVAADTVSLNIIFEGLLMMVLTIMMKKIQLKTRVKTSYPIYDQNG